MEISFRLTLEDKLEFMVYSLDARIKRTERGFRNRFVQGGMLLIMGVVYLYWNLDGHTSDMFGIFLILLSIYYFFFKNRYRRAVIWDRSEEVFRNGRNFREEIEGHLRLTDDEILINSIDGTTSYKLNALEKIDETEDYTFIYMDPFMAWLLPRKSIINGDYRKFVDALKEKFAAANDLAA